MYTIFYIGCLSCILFLIVCNIKKLANNKQLSIDKYTTEYIPKMGFDVSCIKEDIIMTEQIKENPDTHIYLYAKGWYNKSDNIIDDLKVILGHRSGLGKEAISRENIVMVLLDITYDRLQDTDNVKDQFITFISDLNPSKNWIHGGNRHDDFYTILINRCLSILRFCKPGTLNLGKPDPNILPLITK